MMNLKGMYTTILVVCAVLTANGCGNRTGSVTTADPDKIADGPKVIKPTRLGVRFTGITGQGRTIRFRLHFDVNFSATQPVEGHYMQAEVSFAKNTNGNDIATKVRDAVVSAGLPVTTELSGNKLIFNWTSDCGTTVVVHNLNDVEISEPDAASLSGWKPVAILTPGHDATILDGLTVEVTNDSPTATATSPTTQSHK